jgi:hypothetical protein
MNFASRPVTPDENTGQVFDIQGFKNLLSDLKESKRQQEDKAKPTYEAEE